MHACADTHVHTRTRADIFFFFQWVSRRVWENRAAPTPAALVTSVKEKFATYPEVFL